VMFTEQVAEAPEGLPRVQLPPGVNVTVPVGAVAPLLAVSVTDAVQLVAWFITTVPGEQATFVLVGSTVKTPTPSEKLPWLPS
jgi:hypothetical protein